MWSLKAMNRVLLKLRHPPLLPLSLSNPTTFLPLQHSFLHFSPLRSMDSSNTAKSPANDLSIKTCVPCNSKELQPMTEDAANSLIPKVSEWNLVNEGGSLKLSRSWKVKSFNKGLEFFRIIADLADAQGHHPDLHLVGWNNVTIEIWTHSVGGLTENDFILAAKINELNLHGLLRRKSSD